MRGKNEVLVGATVVLALLLVAFGTYWLTGRPWAQEQRDLVATFDQVGILTEGGKVKYRGVTIGRVETIALAERGTGVFVTMSVDPAVTLPQDAAVILSPESLFGDWQAEIVSQSAPLYQTLDFKASTDPRVLPGTALPDISQLTQVAARIAADIEVLSDRIQITFTEETAVRLRDAIENVSEVSEQLGGFVDTQTRTYDQVSRNILSTTANVRAASADAQRVVQNFGAAVDRGDIEAILNNARQASQNLQQLSAQLQGTGGGSGVPGLLTRADSTVTSFGQTARSANALLEDLRPAAREAAPAVVQARQTLAEAQATLAKVSQAASAFGQGGGTFGRLLEDPALYEELQRTITSLNRLLADVQSNPARYIGELRVLP